MIGQGYQQLLSHAMIYVNSNYDYDCKTINSILLSPLRGKRTPNLCQGIIARRWPAAITSLCNLQLPIHLHVRFQISYFKLYVHMTSTWACNLNFRYCPTSIAKIFIQKFAQSLQDKDDKIKYKLILQNGQTCQLFLLLCIIKCQKQEEKNPPFRVLVHHHLFYEVYSGK